MFINFLGDESIEFFKGFAEIFSCEIESLVIQHKGVCF